MSLMKETILTIADIPLSLKSNKEDFLPPSFRRFKNNSKQLTNHIWYLESLGIEKTVFPRNKIIFKKINAIKQRFHFSNQSNSSCREKQKSLLYLSSQYPRLIPRVSFYFNDPVEINPKEKKIRHFYLKEYAVGRTDNFDSRLVTFAYSQILPLMQGFLAHCACVVKDRKAFLFFAASGGGKSTVAKLSKQYSVLGDDIIAVRKIKGRFLAFPTPWIQKESSSKKNSPPAIIKAIFFLKKSERIYFEPLLPEVALARTLLQHIHFFFYTEKPLVEKIFFTAANFFKTVPAYEMHFRKDDNFWPVLEKIIK